MLHVNEAHTRPWRSPSGERRFSAVNPREICDPHGIARSRATVGVIDGKVQRATHAIQGICRCGSR
eukprot:890667-Prorocentrum_lima.AAC.1